MNEGQFSVPVSSLAQLEGASDDLIAAVEVGPIGLGLHWEELDADVSVVALDQQPKDSGGGIGLCPDYHYIVRHPVHPVPS
jgi:hypothetical protein